MSESMYESPVEPVHVVDGAPDPHDVVPAVDAPRVHRIWWIALFVAVGLLVGAGVAARAASSSRDAARADAVRAESQLVRARAHAAEARAARDDARAGAVEVRVGLAGPLATVENLVQLSEQGLTATRDAQAVAHEQSYAAVEAYNEAVTRANVVRDQFDAATVRLDQQIEELLGIDVPTV